MDIRIYPPEEMLEASPALPLSKSQSNRLLIINAICGMLATAAKTAECDDTKAMIAALESGADTINIGGAGTAMRFLTAYFAAMPDGMSQSTETTACASGPLAHWWMH